MTANKCKIPMSQTNLNCNKQQSKANLYSAPPTHVKLKQNYNVNIGFDQGKAPRSTKMIQVENAKQFKKERERGVKL